MQDSIVLVDKSDHIATVTLNRPEHLNALSAELRLAIAQIFRELRTDDDIWVVILTGKGRAFTTGLDLRELGAGPEVTESALPVEDLQDAIENLGKPLIGAINGFAITGGFEIALMCDILIASTEAKFADTHVRVGVVPGWGLSQKLPRLIGISRAKELSFTGNYLDAMTAERWGIVNRVVEPDELMPTCVSLAKDICSVDPKTLSAVHKLIDYGWKNSLEEGLELESKENRAHMRDFQHANVAAQRLDIQARGRDEVAGEKRS